MDVYRVFLHLQSCSPFLGQNLVRSHMYRNAHIYTRSMQQLGVGIL